MPHCGITHSESRWFSLHFYQSSKHWPIHGAAMSFGWVGLWIGLTIKVWRGISA